MTMDDAIDRACALWGQGCIVQVVLRADGSADVGLQRPTDLQAVGEAHRLDPQGRPSCHSDCRRIDDARRQA